MAQDRKWDRRIGLVFLLVTVVKRANLNCQQNKMNEMTDMDITQMEEERVVPRNDAVVGDFLSLARQLVDQGKPSQALQAVVMAVRTKGGEQAVFCTLHRARELYRSKLQASAEADQLASMFAECVIAEAQPQRMSRTETSPSPLLPPPAVMMPPLTAYTMESDSCRKSILEESGRKQIVLNAFADGSSFICLKCGGLVSNQRKDEHYAYWCQF